MTKLEYYQIQDYYKAGISEEDIAERLNISTLLVHKAILNKLYSKQCKVCGKEFYSIEKAFVCSKECKKKNDVIRAGKRWREKKARTTKTKIRPVTDFAVQAKKRGLTYEQLQQLETLGRM